MIHFLSIHYTLLLLCNMNVCEFSRIVDIFVFDVHTYTFVFSASGVSVVSHWSWKTFRKNCTESTGVCEIHIRVTVYSHPAYFALNSLD